MLRIALLALLVSIISIASGPAQAGGAPCSAGSFSSNGIEPCTQCDAGTFAASQGATSCEPCGIGSFTTDVGSSSCRSCDPGSFAAQPGTISCTPCEAGHFVDFAGAPECLTCPPGYFADQPGQTSCLLCSAGSFAAGGGSSTCEPCAAGSYTETLGSTSCSQCSPGTHSAELGATSPQACTPCPVGFYASGSGAATCDGCPRNSFAPSIGSAECLACGCDDAIACTRDSCDRVSGVCSAPPVSNCQPVEVAFSGTVTYVDSPLASTTPLGSAVEGRFAYDPEAPDATPADPSRGDYPNAVTAFEVSIGVGSAIGATSQHGSVKVENGSGFGGDSLAFEATAADGLDGPPLDALPDGVRESYLLRLADPGGTALASDALPAAPPNFARFANRIASLEIQSSAAGTVYVDANDVQSAPEAPSAVATATVLASLLALARRTRRAQR